MANNFWEADPIAEKSSASNFWDADPVVSIEPKEESGFLSNIGTLAKSGYETASESVRAQIGGDEDIAKITAERNRRMAGEQQPTELLEVKSAFKDEAALMEEGGAWNTTKGIAGIVGEIGKQVLTNPKGVAYLGAEQAANMAAIIAGRYPGVVGGSAIGAAVPLPGATVAGGLIGGALTGGTAEYALEAGGATMEGLARRAQAAGVDIKNEDAIRGFIQSNPQALAESKEEGAKKGFWTALVDQAMMGVSGRIASAPARAAQKEAAAQIVGTNAKLLADKAIAKTVADKADEILKATSLGERAKYLGYATGTEMLGGMGSEAAGQYAAYDKLDWNEIALEGLGELVTGPIEAIAVGRDYTRDMRSLRGQKADPADIASKVIDTPETGNFDQDVDAVIESFDASVLLDENIPPAPIATTQPAATPLPTTQLVEAPDGTINVVTTPGLAPAPTEGGGPIQTGGGTDGLLQPGAAIGTAGIEMPRAPLAPDAEGGTSPGGVRTDAVAPAQLVGLAEGVAVDQADAAIAAANTWDVSNRTRRSDEWFDGAKVNEEARRGFTEALEQNGATLQAHGMAKEGTLSGGIKNLLNLLQNGLDTNRGGGRLDTAPLVTKPGEGLVGATASGSAYSEGPFMLVARNGERISGDLSGVGAILINQAHADIATQIAAAIHAIRPDIIVAPYSEAGAITKQLLETRGTPSSTSTNAQPATPLPESGAPGAVIPPAVQPVVPQAPVAPQIPNLAETLKPAIEQLIKRKAAAGQIRMGTHLAIAINKAKAAIESGTGKAADFTKIAKQFKGKDDQIHTTLLSIANALEPVKPSQKKPQKASTDLLQRIKQLGGIDGTLALDITGEKRAPAGWKFAFKKGGTGLDDLATMLASDGFMIDTSDVDGGVQQLRDMIRDHIGGERNFKAQTQEAQGEAMYSSRDMDALAQRADELGIKWKNLNAQQLSDAVYEAEDAQAMDALDAADNLEEAAELSDAVFNGIAYDEDIEFSVRTPNEIAAWLGEDDGQEGVAGTVQGAVVEGQEVGAGRNIGADRQEAETGQEVLQSYTNQEVLDAEAARERAGREEHAQILRDAAARAGEQEASTVKRNVNTVASDNFQLGQSKEEVKRMAQTGVVDMFNQPAKPAPEAAAESKPTQEQQATAILDRANVTGKDRLDIMRDFKDGKHSLDDLDKAYPVVEAKTAHETPQDNLQSAEATQPSLADLNSGRAFADGIKRKIAEWVAKATNNGSRPMDRNWERAAVKRFVEQNIKAQLSGAQIGNRAATKIAVAKSDSFANLEIAIEKYVDKPAPSEQPASESMTIQTRRREVDNAEQIFAKKPSPDNATLLAQTKDKLKAALAKEQAANQDQSAIDQADDDMDAALSDLGDIIGRNFRATLTPEQEQKLLPVLVKLFDAAFRKGYYKFKEAARFVLDTIAVKFGQAVADEISIEHLQSGYIGMSGRYKDQGAEKARDVVAIESKGELGESDVTDERSRTNLERDRQDAEIADGVGEEGVRAGRDGNGGIGGQGVQDIESEGGARRGDGISGRDAAVDGERGDLEIYTGAPPTEASIARDSLDQRSDSSGLDGAPIESDATSVTEELIESGLSLEQAKLKQLKADKAEHKPGLANIRETLPILTEGQQEDVHTAETRFSQPEGYGMLFTNWTGTGKTFLGLGIIKRFVTSGKSNIIISVPNDKIADDWQKSGKLLGLNISRLENTQSAGSGVVITTYSNFGQNNELAKRGWDLIVHDEAHYLKMDSKGTDTLALGNLRAISLHKDGASTRASMIHADLAAKLRNAAHSAKMARMSDDQRDWANIETLQKKEEVLAAEWRKASDAVRDDVNARQGEARPRVLFLSATPFAYEKTVDWANGYLFDYDEGKPADGYRSYNAGSNSDQFMVQHFGYRMRTGKLTEPDAKVDRGLMQRQFNTWMKKRGVLAGRMLDVKADYDRRFVLVDSAIGQRIDAALQWFGEQQKDENSDKARNGALSALRDTIGEKFDYLSRRYLLEAIKAQEVIPHVREHMALGRKVVVFHDYKKGGGFNPFDVTSNTAPDSASDADKAAVVAYNAVLAEFRAEFKDLIASDVWKASSPITAFQKAFPNVLLFNGDVSAKERRANVEKFQDDASGVQVMLVQSAAGKEGISLHDTTGKHQRVLFNLGQPTQPTTAIQQEGRIYRTGQVTDAIFRYLNTGTNWEKWAFATTVANRASAAENLGMGEQARALKDAFIAGFEESDNYRAGMENEGKGGKERDKAANNALTEYDRARAFYFGTQKKNSRTKAQEGTDYFATPEPVGLKMMELADIRTGESVLEPSAGHGAIARWAPETAERTAIEPSMTLRPRLAMVFDGKIIGTNFEDLNVVNKYDAIVMNPPFGSGGRTAIDHLAKAATHLREGGRIVALIPTGPAADAKFDKWFYEESTKPVKPLGEVTINGVVTPIYRGDTIESRASWAPTGKVTGWRDGAPIVAAGGEFRGAESIVSKESIKTVQPTGKRAEAFSPTKGFSLVADIALPSVTFERAGTAVNTRIVVIERSANAPGGILRSYTDATDINDLFDRMESLSISPRSDAREVAPETVAPKVRGQLENEQAKTREAAAIEQGLVATEGAEITFEIKGDKLITNAPTEKVTTKSGKELEGVFVPPEKFGYAQIKAIDKFTYSPGGREKGLFVRLKHIERPAAKFSQSATQASNPHTLSTLTVAIDKAMGKGFAGLLKATGKFKLISSTEIGKYIGESAQFSKAQDQTDTPAFKAWFGDSKVVDADGKPITLYHGGTRFDAFRKDTDSGAHYATDSIDVAQGFASQYEIDKAEIKPLYLRMENPLDLRTPEAFEEWTGITPESGFSDYGILASMARNNTQIRSGGKLLERAKAAGYDGIIFHDTDVMNRSIHTSYAFFDQTQAKLAPDTETKGGTWWDYQVRQGGNIGTFEGADIRYSADGSRILAFVLDGETHLVYDNISQKYDNVKGILTHEVALHALKLGRTDAEFQSILKKIESMRRMGNKKVQEARDMVPEDTDPNLVLEETAGYLLENNPDLPIIKQLIARIRALLRSIGKSLPVMQRMQWFKWADSLTDEDVIFMASQAMKTAPQALAQTEELGMIDDNLEVAYAKSYREANRGAIQFWDRFSGEDGRVVLDRSEIARAYGGEDRGSARTGSFFEHEGVAEGAETAGTEIVMWNDTFAEESSYFTLAERNGEEFSVFVIPAGVVDYGKSIENAISNPVDYAAIKLTFLDKNSDGSYESGIVAAEKGTPAFDYLDSRGLMKPTGQYDSSGVEYYQLQGVGSEFISGLISESVRRLAVNEGEIPTVTMSARDTGARPGKRNVILLPDDLVAKFTTKPTQFYSQLTKAVRDTPDRIFSTGKQVALWLQANTAKLEVKKEELHWSGVLDWLQTQGKVSKADVLEYLQGNGVVVEEGMLGEGIGEAKEIPSFPDWAHDQGYSRNAGGYWDDAIEREYNDFFPSTGDTYYESTPKFAQYVPPGAKPGTYRELLLTLPATDVGAIYRPRVVEVAQSNEPPRFDLLTEDGTVIDTYNTWSKAQDESYRRWQDAQIAAVKARPEFSSSHYPDHPNLIAHLRVDEVEGANGERLLRVVEVQSDWSAAGRKSGFAGKDNTWKALDKDGRVVKSGSESEVKDWDKSNSGIVERIIQDVGSTGVPSAPFVQETQSYVALAIKKAISYAAQNGMDGIVFATGQQNADLYDLSKQVEKIETTESNSKGERNVFIHPKNEGEIRLLVNGDGIVEGGKYAGERLDEVVGKEISDKILASDKAQSFAGDGLRVGGTGMLKFYDEIVPSVANKVLKQIGADVKVGELRIGQGYAETGARHQLFGNQPGFLLSDPISAKIRREGVPLFSKQASIPGTAQPPAQPPRQGKMPLQGGQPGNRASWDSPEPSMFDDLVRKLQDKHIDLKRVVQAIKDTGQQIADKFNPYIQEELFHGRASKRVKDFINTELKPLTTEMKMRGQTLAELDQFLHARHAKEANALIAERDPNMPDGGSGMTNQEADDYFAKLPADKRKRLEATAKRVDAIIAKTREYYASYGLVSRDTVDGWADMFEHYVPLMREDKDGYMGIGQGFSIKGKEVKHRTGSTAKVVDILANIAMQREKAIVRGEKNRVAMALAGLAKLNPNPDFWSFDKPPTERVLNEKTGLVEERIDPTFRSKSNVVAAKIKDGNGQVHERAIIFNEHNERAMRMAEAMKNLDAVQLGGLLRTSASITRYFSAINTQYNPIFGVTNLVRDVQAAALNLTSTPLAGKQKEVLGHVLSAAKGIYLDARAERKGAPATSKWAALWEELQDQGGMTGYRDMYRVSEDRAKAIEHELDPHNWVNNKWGQVFTAGGMLKVPLTKAQDVAAPLFDWLSDYNLMMEGATRLSIYKTAIDNGLTKQQAASLAKNTTVNFNRKGQSGQQAGALYAFFNAAMQGTARIGETLFDMQKGDIKTLRLSKTGKKIVAGGILLGVMQTLALAAAGFDDDEPPEFLRERNLIIPIGWAVGGKRYISIPMPLGFHAIPNIGRISTEYALGGFKKPVDHVIRLLGVFAEAFNPMGSSGLSLQTIAPTALDPFAALEANKDWTGKPIYKEDFSSMKPTPGFTRNKDTASAWSKFIAEGVNYATGGTDYTPGTFSPTADQIDYLIGQVTGGVGRETSKAFQTGGALIIGESLPTHKVPLVGRFYGNLEDQSSQGNRYYTNLKEINLIEMELKGRREDQLPTDEFRKGNPKAQLIGRAKYADKVIAKLRKQKRDLIDKGAERDRVRQVEERITGEMLRFNQAVDKFEARAH